jgi:hypothetical protein
VSLRQLGTVTVALNGELLLGDLTTVRLNNKEIVSATRQ